MKIVIVGYGLFPRIEGGAAVIQREMVRGLLDAGVEVVVVQGGKYNLSRKPMVKASIIDGVKVYDIFNSPNWSGKMDPVSQVSCPSVERLVVDIVDQEAPAVVHAHELTFYSCNLLSVIRARGYPVVKTMHNYWDVCPQRDLLRGDRTNCSDFRDGADCVGCKMLPMITPSISALSRIGSRGTLMTSVKKLVKPALNSLITRSTIDLNFNSTQYANRRSAFVQMLNSLSAIHVYSHGSRKIFEEYGVRSDLLKYIPVSTTLIDSVLRRESRPFSREITFVYRGGLAPNKGVHMLIEAFRGVDQNRAKLIIYGGGALEYEAELKRAAQGARIVFMGRYRSSDLDRINAQTDVGVVPSLANELFGLVGVEFTNAGIPVIASDGGGTKDYVVPGKSGFLFRNGDVQGLRAIMCGIVNEPGALAKLKFERWPTTEYLSSSLLALYHAVRVSKTNSMA